MVKKKGKTKRYTAKVSTHGLFNESDALAVFAQDVLDRFDDTPSEKRNLKRFIRRLATIQNKISELCPVIKGGNPMFRDFRIKPRG